MRITGGSIRGRRLTKIKGVSIRPTSDMVRSSIFNILGQRLTDLAILDLFAGTGSLGIESLSRGAKKAVFIDKSKRALGIIKKNLEITGYEAFSVVIREDLPNGLAHINDHNCDQFDLVFIDPPYGKGYILPTIDVLLKRALLAQECRVIVESSTHGEETLSSEIPRLHLEVVKSYGSTLISIYSNHEERRHGKNGHLPGIL